MASKKPKKKCCKSRPRCKRCPVRLKQREREAMPRPPESMRRPIDN